MNRCDEAGDVADEKFSGDGNVGDEKSDIIRLVRPLFLIHIL